MTLLYHECFLSLVNIFKSCFNISIISGSTSFQRNLLMSNKLHIYNSCAYKIPCHNCDKFFIGQTGAPLNRQIVRHKCYITIADENKAIFHNVFSTITISLILVTASCVIIFTENFLLEIL